MRNLALILILVIAGSCSVQQETKEVEKNKVAEYNEKHRLQFHFSPREKWMNDPNGMVYLDGEYHLFYQYYPDSTIWGPMHWGHAVSKDLVHWEHLPIALYPDSLGYIFSGSAVYDENNTSGLGTANNPPLVAIFTYHNPVGEKAGSDTYQTQAIAFSTDKGRTWTKYTGNPVLPNPGIKDFRDPKVSWLAEQNQWLMTLAVKDHISFYTSPDLINWTWQSDFGSDMGAHGGVWECPDLFELNDEWVLLVSINPGGPNRGSATQYFVGDFDGKTFTAHDDSTRWIDYGRDNYAGVTWSNIPEQDKRKLFMGWMSNWDYAQVVPTEKWRSAMTIPRTLELEGMKLKSYPVEELEIITEDAVTIENSSDSFVDLNKDGFATYELNLELSASEIKDKSFEIQLLNSSGDTLEIGYESAKDSFYIKRDNVGENKFSDQFTGVQWGPAPDLSGDKISIRLLVDVGSVEMFVNEGDLVMTSLFFPREPLDQAIFLQNDESINIKGKIARIKDIW